MARVLKGLPPEFVARNLYPYGHPMHDTFTGSWESRHQLEEEAMELIEKRTTIVRQQVADSYACYEVVQRNPLQLRWIPYCDAWEADPAWLRGLNLSDIERSEQWEARFREVAERNKNSVPYGTQLSFWDDMYVPDDKSIVFDITYCQCGCPFNGVYEARDKESTMFVQPFGREKLAPSKYLITIKPDFPIHAGDRVHHYIVDDQWESFAKIKELTGRNPLWRMSDVDERLPSNYSSHGEKC